MNIDRINLHRPAYRKRKSSLANVLQPLQGHRKPGLAPLAETEDEAPNEEHDEIRFEPFTLPDSNLSDLFNNNSISEDFRDDKISSSSGLPFPIFNQQFIDMHSKEENEVSKISNEINASRRTARILRRKHMIANKQCQTSLRACHKLRANNKQIKDYLSTFKSELLPFLSQLDSELPDSNRLQLDPRTSTQELVHYLKVLGRRVWEQGPRDEITNPGSGNAPPQQ